MSASLTDNTGGESSTTTSRNVTCHEAHTPSVAVSCSQGSTRPLVIDPVLSTTGELEQMALYAGEGAALVSAVRLAAETIAAMMQEAEGTLRHLTGALG